MAKITHVIKRSGDIVKFTPSRISNAIYRAAVSVGGRDRKTAERLSVQVIELLDQITPAGQIPSIEDVQDAVEKVLIENGHAKVAKAYILYRDERARRRNERVVRISTPSTNIPWSKLWQVLDWAVEHGVNTVAGLNDRIERGEFSDVIIETEAAYIVDVENAVEEIASRRDELKMVIISGPSSSGKTTTTIKIGQHLRKRGFSLVTLNVDNYFYDLELHPKDEFGDYDFETPQALDLEMINQHLVRLLAGEEVNIPYYDFKTSKRHDDQTPMKVNKNDILLIDSLHGLYPAMTLDIPDEQKFKLYLEPLLQMKDNDGVYVRWTDIRLIRRMLRDEAFRAYNPQKTLEHWHYVRASELRHIVPNITTTDYIINTSLPYELPIFRAKMFNQFAEWAIQYRDKPLRKDAFIRAKRVHALLKQVNPVEDDSPIPPDSILREFIGGSSYEY
jgi:uridine kinase